MHNKIIRALHANEHLTSCYAYMTNMIYMLHEYYM